MNVEFLGVGSCMPEYEQADTASLLVNRHILVDTGWHVIRNLLRTGVNPRDITALFFTHMHQDHYMSLAALLFYLMNGYHSFGSLEIYGPEDVGKYVDMALTYGGHEMYYSECGTPAVHALAAEQTVSLGDIQVSCIASKHAVPGRCYRFQDIAAGGSFVYSGDTAPFDALAEFARGSDVLIHEASFQTRETPADNPYCHSSAMDAAHAAAKAGVKTLYMVHAASASREATIAAAGEIFPDCRRPMEGDGFCV